MGEHSYSTLKIDRVTLQVNEWNTLPCISYHVTFTSQNMNTLSITNI